MSRSAHTHGECHVAIVGAGDVGTDLMVKIQHDDGPLRVAALVDTDPDVEGLLRGRSMGVPTTDAGIQGLLRMPHFGDIKLVFDATTAGVHGAHRAALKASGIRMVNLTPAAAGAYCVPAVNLRECLDTQNISLVSCGGQAAIPIVAAVSCVGGVAYAEAVISISSKSVGPGIRGSIDEFIESTTAAMSSVGGARQSKVVLVINPADPPVMMRTTVYCLVDGDADCVAIEESITSMVARVNGYMPGYRLKQEVLFESFSTGTPLGASEAGRFRGTRVTAMLEVAGAGGHLPVYAGNLDMMTSAAKIAAEHIMAAGASGLRA